MKTIELDGRSLTPAKLATIASGGKVTIAAGCKDKIADAWQVLQTAIDNQTPVYGVTTGLGPHAVDAMPTQSVNSFALSTLRGRAHALGTPMHPQLVRAALAVRLNTLLIGATSVRPELADFLVDCINAGLTPVVGETASIGAADLLWGASSGLALCGEGKMQDRSGNIGAAASMLEGAGLAPWQPAPREGLALASHAGFTAAIAAIGLERIGALMENAEYAAALSIEGFRANLSPLDQRVLNLRPQPGQELAALRLRQKLGGSLLFDSNNARRLQDPLSIRNIVQVHGAVYAVLELAENTLDADLNGATDNPATLVQEQQILSHGGYLAPLLGIALTAIAQALATLAVQQSARMAKMLSNRFSALPNGLKSGGLDSAGLAPLHKVIEALQMEVSQAALVPSLAPSPSADALEDCTTVAPLMAKTLLLQIEKLQWLCACETLIAVHSVRMRDVEDSLPEPLLPHYREISARSAPMTEDRSLSDEIEWIVEHFNAHQSAT